jgi:hypothetical protein
VTGESLGLEDTGRQMTDDEGTAYAKRLLLEQAGLIFPVAEVSLPIAFKLDDPAE